MIQFKPGALVWWSADNCKISLFQFQKRERSRLIKMQGLLILANFGEPKFTILTYVKPEVFNGPIVRIEVNIQMVIESLARIFDTHTKVRDIVLSSILAIFNQKGSFDWTFD